MCDAKVPSTVLVRDVITQTRAGNSRGAISVQVRIDTTVANFCGRKGGNRPAKAMPDDHHFERRIALGRAC